MNIRTLILAIALGLAATAGTGVRTADAAEALSNADVMEMAKAGLAPEVIIAAIRAAPNAFDLSTRSILQLNENGVPESVITAMLANAANQPAPSASADRVRSELAGIATGSPEARETSLAWFVANRDAALPELRSYLSEANPANRAAAALALGRLGDSQSTGNIRNLLTDPAPEVRKNAAQSLFLLGDQQAVMAAEQAIARRVDPLDGFIRLVGHSKMTQAAGQVTDILANNQDANNRAAAAWALGEIGRAGISARPVLEKALASDPEPQVRREAAQAVAKFYDQASASSLIDACRSDPAVRKVTLAALADYPEAVEFLVGVINISPDQIAADELETARASLVRLTGQDYGLDGQRWNQWLAANQSTYATTAAPSRPTSDFGGMIPDLPVSTTTPGQIDIEAWGIVADSSLIPTAPMPSGAAGAPPAPMGAGASGFGGSPWAGMASSPDSYGSAGGSGAGASPGGSTFSAGVPTLMPDLDMPDSGLAGQTPGAPAGSDPATANLRTWTSDPERMSQRDRQAQQDGEIPGWASAFEPVRSALSAPPGGGESSFQASSPDSGLQTLTPGAAPEAGRTYTVTSEPQFETAIAAPAPAASPAPAQPPTGISLPIPGMSAGASAPAPAASEPLWTQEVDSYLQSSGGDASGDWNAIAESPASAASAPSGEWKTLDPDSLAPEGEPFYAAPADNWPAPSGSADSAVADPYGDWPKTHSEGAPMAGDDSLMSDPYPFDDWAAPAASADTPPADPYVATPESDAPMVMSGDLPPMEAPIVPADSPAAPAPDFATGDSAPAMPPAFSDSAAPTETGSGVSDAAPAIVDSAAEALEKVGGEAEALTASIDESATEAAEAVVDAAAAAAEDPGYRTDLFVEPEPGQIVITDTNPMGVPQSSAAYTVTAPGSPAPTAAPAVTAAPPTAPTPTPAPASASTPAPVPTPAPQQAAAAPAPQAGPLQSDDLNALMESAASSSSAGQGEVFRSSSPEIPPPPPQNEYAAPDMKINYSGSQQLAKQQQEQESGAANEPGRFLVDPSTPLPPVKPEGTVSAPKGKDVPLLGQGFF